MSLNQANALLARRLRHLKIDFLSLLPLQLRDLCEDAVARFRICGDPNGDPLLVEEDNG